MFRYVSVTTDRDQSVLWIIDLTVVTIDAYTTRKTN